MDDNERKINALNSQSHDWTVQMIAIAQDIHLSRAKRDYKQVKHFANLLRHNINQIEKLSDQAEALLVKV